MAQEKIKITALGINEGMRDVLKKYFSKSEFLFNNFNLTFIENTGTDYAYDCVLVNSDISADELKCIKHNHPTAYIFYIPSFNALEPEDMQDEDMVISEPFKLSELERSLKDIYERKMFTRD